MVNSRKLSVSFVGLICVIFMAASAPSADTPTVGHAALPFNAKTMDGKEVSFPKDYKGRLVILDFWATWCGPCMHEVPGLVKAYEEYHPQGVEILGITLDQANAKEKVKRVTSDKKMTWRQVYDGKGWQARVAQMYGIESIPHAFLIDGDTGKVIADGNSLRGDNLGGTLAEAVKNKKASK